MSDEAFEARLASALARAAREIAQLDALPTTASTSEQKDVDALLEDSGETLVDPTLSCHVEERDAILRSVGIDPACALAKYEEELERDGASAVARALACARCEVSASLEEVRYVAGELLCDECADAALVEERRSRDEDDGEVRSDFAVVRAPDPNKATLKAAAYGLFFFSGIVGPLGVVFDMWIVALLLGSAVAALGATHVYKVSVA
jgi:hypothetical protein